MPVGVFVGLGTGDRLDQDQTARRLIPAIEPEVLVIDDPKRRLGHGVEDLLGIEALDDPRGYILQKVLAPLQQQLAAPADVDELNHGGGGEDTRHQADDVARITEAKPSCGGDEKVIGDGGDGRGRRNRRAATQAPGDHANKQYQNEEKRLHPRDSQNPGQAAEAKRGDADSGDGGEIGDSSIHRALPRYGIA